MVKSVKNRIYEYNLRRKKHLEYVNQHLQFTNKQNELMHQLEQLGFTNTSLEVLRQRHTKTLISCGYLPQDIDQVLQHEYKTQGITKYNKQEIAELRRKLIHIAHYIRFLEKKIARTN